MKALLALVLTAIVGGSLACGSSLRPKQAMDGVRLITNRARDTRPGSPRTLDVDEDQDGMNRYRDGRHDYDDRAILEFGRIGTKAEIRTVALLMRRYYLAASRDDGRMVCAVLVRTLAKSVAMDYGRPPGPASLRGDTCAAVMVKLFRQRHRQLIDDAANFHLTTVRVRQDEGVALLRFGKSDERHMPLRRDAGAWRIAAFGDMVLP